MFDPFAKEFRAVTSDDLAKLRRVSEGWFVEYKKIVPDPRSIAESVSAFANHEGGWVFYGVSEDPGADKTADAFPGIPVADAQRMQQHG